MARPKRYEEYPQLARLVRAMSPEGRELVAHWHRVLITALEGYVPHATSEMGLPYNRVGGQSLGADAARLGARTALQGWLNTMRSVAALLADPSEGDWCCKRGMVADPLPCPQHGWDPTRPEHIAEGTIIERTEPGSTSRKERCVAIGVAEGPYWASVQHGHMYDEKDLSESGPWTVVGRV